MVIFPIVLSFTATKKNSPEKKKNYRTDFNTIQMNKKERGYSFPCILTPMNTRIFHAAANNRSNCLIPNEKIRYEKSLKLVPTKYKKISIHSINFSGKLRVESFKLVTSFLVTIPTDCQQLFFLMRLGSRKVIQKKRGLKCSLTSQLYKKNCFILPIP